LQRLSFVDGSTAANRGFPQNARPPTPWSFDPSSSASTPGSSSPSTSTAVPRRTVQRPAAAAGQTLRILMERPSDDAPGTRSDSGNARVPLDPTGPRRGAPRRSPSRSRGSPAGRSPSRERAPPTAAEEPWATAAQRALGERAERGTGLSTSEAIRHAVASAASSAAKSRASRPRSPPRRAAARRSVRELRRPRAGTSGTTVDPPSGDDGGRHSGLRATRSRPRTRKWQ